MYQSEISQKSVGSQPRCQSSVRITSVNQGVDGVSIEYGLSIDWGSVNGMDQDLIVDACKSHDSCYLALLWEGKNYGKNKNFNYLHTSSIVHSSFCDSNCDLLLRAVKRSFILWYLSQKTQFPFQG